jgi:Na+/proline symporter
VIEVLTSVRIKEGSAMGIGGSIFLLVVGAILAFAVDADISGIDINVIGWILMAAGLVGLLITIWYWNSRRRTVVTRQTSQPVTGAPARPAQYNEYRETRRDDVPPPPPPGY